MSTVVIDAGNSKYTDDIRREACLQYAIKGNQAAVCKDMDIPAATLHGWKESEWWQQLTEEHRNETNAQIRASYTQIIQKGADVALTALNSGEVKGKDAMTISAIAYDKVRLIDNMPTSITSSGNTALQNEFEKLSKRTQELEHQANAKIVSDNPKT